MALTATEAPTAVVANPRKGQLAARPSVPATSINIVPGVSPLGLVEERDPLIFVPASYTSSQPAPLALLLHGAGGTAEAGIGLLQPLANQAGLLLLAPASRRETWDVITGGYGPDVQLIDRALAHVFSRYAVDPARLAVGGFSDGASYALSLGLTNGGLFRKIIAFSPGFMAPAGQVDTPRVFIAHGTRDEVLPIERCSRQIVPQLKEAHYDVTYHEFDGPHTVPPDIARAAVDWYLK
jgi:phospholipase/carboxylesterase